MIKNHEICKFVLSGISKMGQKAFILAIWENFGKPKMVKNHQSRQFCVFRNPQNKPKSFHFSHFGSFGETQNGHKSRKSRKLQFCGFRNPQNRPKSPYFGHLGRFREAQNGQNHKNLQFCAFQLLFYPLAALTPSLHPRPPSIERKHRKLHSGNIGNSILETSARKLHSGNIRSETSAWKHRLGSIQLASKQFLFILGLRV